MFAQIIKIMKKNSRSSKGWYDQKADQINACRVYWRKHIVYKKSGWEGTLEDWGDAIRSAFKQFAIAAKNAYTIVHKPASVGFSSMPFSPGTKIKLVKTSVQFSYMLGREFYLLSWMGGVMGVCSEWPCVHGVTYLLIEDCQIEIL